jgi:SAM-dependent methyltransferase
MPGIHYLVDRIIPSEFDMSNPDEKDFLDRNIEIHKIGALFVEGKTVLDIGCGAGYGTVLFRTLGRAAKVVGIDSDKSVLEIAEREYNAEGIEYRHCAYEELDGSEKFDVVANINCSKYFPDLKGFLAKAEETLAPGGRLIFTAYVTPTTDFNPFHLRDHTARSFRRLLRKAGFRITHEFMQTKHFSLGKSISFATRKDTVRGDKSGFGPLLLRYILNPVKAARRIRSLIADGLTVKNMLVVATVENERPRNYRIP